MLSKKAAIIGGSAFLIALVVVSCIAGFIYETRRSDGMDSIPNTSQKAILDLCHDTYYQETCITSLTNATSSSNPKTLIKSTFLLALDHLTTVIDQTVSLQIAARDPNTAQAYRTCQKLLDDSIYDLRRTFERLDSFEVANLKIFIDDLKTWLTGALTYQETCIDCFQDAERDARLQMHELLKFSRELTVNSLALVHEFSKSLSSNGRSLVANPVKWSRILSGVANPVKWSRILSGADRGRIMPDVIVAKDGSGKYKTINEALREVPLKSKKRFVIYIKEGVYEEYVTVSVRMLNVMFIGDGPTKTKITGNKSNKGWNNLGTELTATVVIEGDNFIARDIGFENTAGAVMHQAVALRVAADRSIFHNCQIDGYQDTLYSQTHRQYYRDCTISGTIDFIFGNAEAVLQNCTLLVRKPLTEQRQCMVTANGRTTSNETSAFVLQDCHIRPAPEYPINDNTYKTFLGRPWKPYSKTIVVNSYLDTVIDPEGWSPWNNTNAHLDTCFYAEVNNKGPGADLRRRVTWPGIKEISVKEAAPYTPREFLGADFWIASKFVPFQLP